MNTRTGYCAPCDLWSLGDATDSDERFFVPASPPPEAQAPQEPFITSPFVQVTLATAPPPRVRIQGKPLGGGSTAKGALPSKPSEGIPAEVVRVESVPVENLQVEALPVDSVPVDSVPVESAPVGNGAHAAEQLAAEQPVAEAPAYEAPAYVGTVETPQIPEFPAQELPAPPIPSYERPAEQAVPESVPVSAAPSQLAKAAPPSTSMFWPPPRPSDRANPVVPSGHYVTTDFDEDLEHTRVSNRRSNPKFWTLSLPGGAVEVIVGSVIVGRAASPMPGRAGARLLSIDDPTKSVSKNHAIFTDVGGTLFVEDLESMNGVVVTLADGTESDLFAGQRLRLEHGAIVELGDMRVSVEQN